MFLCFHQLNMMSECFATDDELDVSDDNTLEDGRDSIRKKKRRRSGSLTGLYLKRGYLKVLRRSMINNFPPCIRRDLLLGTIGAGLDKIAVNTSDPYCDPDRGGLWSGLIVIMTQAAFT